MTLFANDVTIYLQITKDTDVTRLHRRTAWADGSYQYQLTNAGRAICDTNLNINGSVLSVLPTVQTVRDFGVSVTQNSSPRLHVSNVVAKANQRAAAIYRDITLLFRAI